MSLTENEKKELALLDNPQVEYLSSSWGGIFSNVFGSSRKDKVVKLRTKMRMGELGLDKNKNLEKYNEILKEERVRFDDRFKKIQ